MRLIGLTGGLGTGKSTVAEMLRQLGATVIDADLGARAVVEPGTPGLERILEEFGPQFVRDGRLDRAALAERVFDDPESRRRLNAIVHPLVGEWMASRQAEAAARGDAVVVLEVPLLYENGLDAGVEEVIVVQVPAPIEIERLMAGPGYTEAQARARIAAQMPVEEKVRRARHVIDNSGPRPSTRAQVERVWNLITAPPA